MTLSMDHQDPPHPNPPPPFQVQSSSSLTSNSQLSSSFDSNPTLHQLLSSIDHHLDHQSYHRSSSLNHQNYHHHPFQPNTTPSQTISNHHSLSPSLLSTPNFNHQAYSTSTSAHQPSSHFQQTAPPPQVLPFTTVSDTSSNTSNLNPLQRKATEVDAIKKALAALPSDTQQNLLMVLLATHSAEPDHHLKAHSHPSLLPLQIPPYQTDQLFTLPSTSDPLVHPTSPNYAHSHHSSRLSQHSQHSQPTTPVTIDTQPASFYLPRDNRTMTPLVSPNMTPLSTFSTSSYPSSYPSDATSLCSQASSFVSACAPVELFSPLTSPALRPQGYLDTLSNRNGPTSGPKIQCMPTLINQAAALGLSNQPIYSKQDSFPLTSPHVNVLDQFPMAAPPRPSSQQRSSSHSKRPNASPVGSTASTVKVMAESVHSSPCLLPTSPAFPASSATRPNGRQRALRPSKSRPSPHMRPVDQTISVDEGYGRSKRAKSVTSGSVASSPVIHPKHSGSHSNSIVSFGRLSDLQGVSQGSNQNFLGDSPSPVDLMAVEVEPPLKLSGDPMSGPSLAPTTTSSITTDPKSKRIQPLTPAGIMNLDHVVGRQSNMKVWIDLGAPKNNKDCMTVAVDSHPPLPTTAGTEHRASPDEIIQSLVDTFGQIENRSSESLPCKNDSPVVDNTQDQGTVECNGRGSTDCSSKPSQKRSLANSAAKLGTEENNSKNKSSSGSPPGSPRADAPETRRSSHKVAEQRRRDSLKTCFEDLRHILPPIHWRDDEEHERRPGEGNVGGQRSSHTFDPAHPNKGISKVALLRRSNEYITTLHERLKRRDGAIGLMLDLLREGSGKNGLEAIEKVLREIEEEKLSDEANRRRVLERRAESDEEQDGSIVEDPGRKRGRKVKKKPAGIITETG